jgi:tyrosyl-tRNA synthetase
MRNVYDVLLERGFIEQATHEAEIKELLGKEAVTFYIGFDPTADSLHIGHFIQVMVMMHMQQHGHKPIALVGGGTVKVGDPTGKTEMRKMLFSDQIDENANQIAKQLAKYIDLSEGKGIAENNANWLDHLNYIDFLREIGSKFSVNRMLTAECFKQRMEKGLSFLEFNYMIMQAYDFLELNRRYDCKLELGGNDQWSNIIAGVDLIRRSEQKEAFGLTFKLLTTSDGRKMGKTEAGAVWIDPEKTSAYELFQYFRNVDDADVINCLKLLTFIPMAEIRDMETWKDADINRAKEILAFEVTKIIHGQEEADKALSAAKALFAGAGSLENVPTTEITRAVFGTAMNILDLLTVTGLIASKGEGRRLIQQNGFSVNGEVVTSHELEVTLDAFENDELMVKKGKKVYQKVKLV